MNNWVYIYHRTEPNYTVGFFDPQGQWHPDSDHATTKEAAERVHWLNGGCKAAQEAEVVFGGTD